VRAFFESTDADLNPLSEAEYLRKPEKSVTKKVKEGVDKVKEVRVSFGNVSVKSTQHAPMMRSGVRRGNRR
jgi:hypothetical protein